MHACIPTRAPFEKLHLHMDCRWVTFMCVWLACCQSWKLPRGNCPAWRPYLAILQKLVEPDHTQIEQNCSPQCSPSARSGESSANRDSSNGIVNLSLISKGFSWEYWCGILLLRQVHLELDSLRVVQNDFFVWEGSSELERREGSFSNII